MDTYVELLLSKNGSWIAVDTEMCEWLFGFAKGDRIILSYFQIDGNEMKSVEKTVTVKDVIMCDGERILLAKEEYDYLAIPEKRIINIEGV